MLQRSLPVKGANVLVMGLTFKENCPDIRNTKVVDLVAELKDYGCEVDVYDPWADAQEVQHEYGLELTADIQDLNTGNYKAVILAVGHKEFKAMGADKIRKLMTDGGVLFDIKYVLPKESVDGRL